MQHGVHRNPRLLCGRKIPRSVTLPGLIFLCFRLTRVFNCYEGVLGLRRIYGKATCMRMHSC
jgi:hypothetical protein